MTCKDCIHYDACLDMYDGNKEDFGYIQCNYFKNNANFVELPCKVGDTVYYPYEYGGKILEKTIKKIVIEKEYRWLDVGVSFLPFENIGKTVFLTKEEAEQKLKGGAKE